MENRPSMNVSQAQRNYFAELVDESEQNHNDVMTRRMKNRERQRRYRARKRLGADSTRPSFITTHSSPEVMDLEPIAVVHNWNTRVLSRRDWKKDARRAHVSKDSEAGSNGVVITIPVSTTESQTSGLTSGAKSEPLLESEPCPDESLDRVNHAVRGAMGGRRDWKAEARTRKS